MDLTELLAIELHLLVPHHTRLTFDTAAEEFPTFFARPVSAEALRTAATDLVKQGVLTEDDGALVFAGEGRGWAHRKMLEFEFSEGQELAARSPADQAFLRELQEAHGYVGMTDETQRSYLVESLRWLSPPVLDAGCGDGALTAALEEQTGHPFLGIDTSDALIRSASNAYPQASFAVWDFADLDNYDAHFGSVLFADSLYFTQDPNAVLSSAAGRLGEGGGIVVLYSVYAGPGKEPANLSPSHTPVKQFAESAGMKCTVTDFSSSEDSMWQAKLEALEQHRPGYYTDRATYLYYSRWKECALLADIAARKRSARFGFVLAKLSEV